MKKLLLLLLPLVSLEAGSILGGELRFNRTSDDLYTNIGGFSLPFLYGNDKPDGGKGPFAIFGLTSEGWCTKLGLGHRISCGFGDAVGGAGDVKPRTAISGGKLIPNALVNVDATEFTFRRFSFDGDSLSAIVPFTYSLFWVLKDAAGNTLNVASGFGRGLGNLQFDSQHNLVAANMDFNAAATPEPISLVLTGTGLAALGLWRRRKNQKDA